MHIHWQKWGLDYLTSLIRHVGTAGMATMAIAVVNGHIDWKAVVAGIVTGGIVPTTFTAFQSFPEAEDDAVTPPTTKP